MVLFYVLFLLQEKTTLPPCWACVAPWPLYRAPSPWQASSPASVWSTSALNLALRSLPARSSRPTTDKMKPLACLPGDAALILSKHPTKTLLPLNNHLHEISTGKSWKHIWIFCTWRWNPHEAEKINLFRFFAFSSSYPLDFMLLLYICHFVLSKIMQTFSKASTFINVSFFLLLNIICVSASLARFILF